VISVPDTPFFTYDSSNEAETALLGRALAEALPPGSVVALDGPLGAGKTRLVQALAGALGIDPRNVVSPTFVLVQEHFGRMPLYHFDAYRLRDEADFLDLGPEEDFSGAGLTVIEWAERVERWLPPDRLHIRVEVTGPDSRRFHITPHGPIFEAPLERIRSQLSTR
jgi:tRNA threonylcarbamoyladenosine biosynthesis protein TsaE